MLGLISCQRQGSGHPAARWRGTSMALSVVEWIEGGPPSQEGAVLQLKDGTEVQVVTVNQEISGSGWEQVVVGGNVPIDATPILGVADWLTGSVATLGDPTAAEAEVEATGAAARAARVARRARRVRPGRGRAPRCISGPDARRR